MTETIIIGAGLGGLALAARLTERGAPVTIYERDKGPTAREQGYSITLMPNGFAALEALGLADEVRATGFPSRGLSLVTRDGRALVRDLDHDESMARYGRPMMVVHRDRLRARLLARVDPARVVWGERCVDVDAASGRVRFASGRVVEGALVVGADGARSSARSALVDDAPVYRGVAYVAGELNAADLPARALELAEARSPWMTLLTSSVFFASLYDGGRLLFSHAFRAHDLEETGRSLATPAAIRRFLEEELRGVHAPVPALVAATRDDRLHAAKGYFDRETIPSFSRDRLVLLGDAAHPMLPHQGQGANLALEDAVELDACLESTSDLGLALERYDRLRVARTGELVQASRASMSWLHCADVAAAAARDETLSLASGTPEAARSRNDRVYGHAVPTTRFSSDGRLGHADA